jgi:DNA-binding NarL/FixJ family response regulator
VEPAQQALVVLVGAVAHGEFRPALDWLSAHTALTKVPDLQGAIEHCRRAPPDLIVLAQRRPGEFSGNAIETLHAAAPLARIIGLLGSWCEGETRTGRPWPGVPRIYWHQFVARLRRELSCPSTFALPRTATDAEQFMSLPSPSVHGGLVVLHCIDRLSYEALSDVVGAAGFAAVRLTGRSGSSVVGAVAGLWECARGVKEEGNSLQQFVTALAPAPVLVLASFPRHDDLCQAIELGAASLLARPMFISDLIHELNAMADACPRHLSRR